MHRPKYVYTGLDTVGDIPPIRIRPYGRNAELLYLNVIPEE
jgi:hypothetical protein